jgi:dTDP-3-amino-3,4,6-trideoxy-alpha-D-glucose transaminase
LSPKSPRVGRDTGVPLVCMDSSDPALFGELMAAVEAVAARGAFTLGHEVEAFEQELAGYCGTREAVGVASGTDALALSLRALGVGTGDEVILPANSFVATAEAVSLAGATPRPVDVDADSRLLTAEIAERAIGPRTRCIIPVHLYGRTVDLDPIMELAREHRLSVVEDACQAHGAYYKGRRAGSIGAAGCFSFYPAKNLGAWGDGGAVVTSDPALADRVRLLRAHGERPRYQHRLVGTTSRLDAVQAAVLRVKLRRLDGWNELRRRAAAALRSALAGTEVERPSHPGEGEDHVYHQFVVRCSERDGLRAHLSTRGIATGVHYPVPIHLTDAYRHLHIAPGSLPVSERLAQEVCSLPLWPGIDQASIRRIADAVREFRLGAVDQSVAPAA